MSVKLRVIGGPIPRDCRVSLTARHSDVIASVLAEVDSELRRLRQSRSGERDTLDHSPIVHSSTFDLLQLDVIGGSQGKVVAVLDPDAKVQTLLQAASHKTSEIILLLRPRTTLPPGIPRGPQHRVLRLAAPLIVEKKKDHKAQAPPPPKPDYALRIIGGPIPRDVRIVIKVLRTTCFLDMFPLIHEKVELVVPLAVVSSRYYTLYEFEMVAYGRGKKRRALFAKDTPESIQLVSNVLMLEEKPLWQHIRRPLSAGAGDNAGENVDGDESAESDNLSDIRPASATSTLRDRDVDTPPNTIGAARDGLETPSTGVECGGEGLGWWEAEANGAASKSRALTIQALKVRDFGLDGGTSGAGGKILELVSPQNQQAQLIRVIGKCIPRTARVIIDILRTQTFMSMFPLIQALVLEFLPTAQISAYRYEMVELRLLPNGKTKEVQTLKLDQTPWSCDFGLASVIYLREVPEGFLKGAEHTGRLSNLSLQYGDGDVFRNHIHSSDVISHGGADGVATKPGTATSMQSRTTVVARGPPQMSTTVSVVGVDDFEFDASQVVATEAVDPQPAFSTVAPDASPTIANAEALPESNTTPENNIPIAIAVQRTNSFADTLEAEHDAPDNISVQGEAEAVVAVSVAHDAADEPKMDVARASPRQRDDDGTVTLSLSPHRESSSPQYCSPIRASSIAKLADIPGSSDEDDDAHCTGSQRVTPKVGLKPARASSRYLLYQEPEAPIPRGDAGAIESDTPAVAVPQLLAQLSGPPPRVVPLAASLPHSNLYEELETLELEYDAEDLSPAVEEAAPAAQASPARSSQDTSSRAGANPFRSQSFAVQPSAMKETHWSDDDV